MDARSRLAAVNTAISKKRETILNLSPSLDTDGFQAQEAKRHRNATRLFYHSIMSAYGYLVALEMVGKEQADATKDKYKPFLTACTHQLEMLWELISGPMDKMRHEERLSKLATEYREVINQFKSELYKPTTLTDELLHDHVTTINAAFIKMILAFTDEKTAISMPFIKRLLTIAMAYEFIILVEYELRLHALDKAKYVAKDSNELEMYCEIFVGNTETALSCQPLRDDLKKMIDALESDSFEDIFACFKENCDKYPYSSGFHTDHDHESKKRRKDSYASKHSLLDTSMGSVLAEVGTEARVDIQRDMRSHIDESNDALLEKFTRKLGNHLGVLKQRYLGETGEFAHIDKIMEALESKETLPHREGSHHFFYLDTIDPMLAPPQLRKNDTEERLDDDIVRTLRQLTAPKTPSEPLEDSPSASASLMRPDHSPSVEESDSESESASSQAKRLRARSPLAHASIRSNSHSKSEESDDEEHLKQPKKALVSVGEAKPRLLTSSVLSISSTASTSASTSEEVFDVPVKPVTRKRSASHVPVYHRRQDDGIKSTPTSVNFMRPSPGVILKPSLAKSIIVALGIGLAVSAAVALGVALGFLFIHGGAPVMIAAFATTAKILGGSTIGAWSAAGGVLMFPPIASMFIGIKHWQHRCRDLLATSGALLTRKKSTIAPGAGTTKAVISRSRIASEPLPDGVRMRASAPLRRRPVARDLVTGPTLFDQAVKGPAEQKPRPVERALRV